LALGAGSNAIGDKKGLDFYRYGIKSLLTFDNVNRLKEENLKNTVKE